MKIKQIKQIVVAMVIGLFAIGGCSEPSRYEVYGICYTNQADPQPLQNARLDFIVSDYGTVGYTTTDAEGKFAFFFWDDGNGNIQESLKGKASYTDDRTGEIVYTQPVTITFKGQVLFNGQIRAGYYTQNNPLVLYYPNVKK